MKIEARSKFSSVVRVEQFSVFSKELYCVRKIQEFFGSKIQCDLVFNENTSIFLWMK